MREFARDFYQSREWMTVSRAYMTAHNYLCERCGRPAKICHHKTYLKPTNISNPEITLSFDNLECLCQDCHNKEHSLKHTITKFSDDGQIIGVKRSGEEVSFLRDRDRIDELLKKMTS